MSPILNYVDFIKLLEQKIEPQIIQGPKGDPYQYKKEGEKFLCLNPFRAFILLYFL